MPLSKHPSGYPPASSALLLLCPTKLLVLKLLLIVRLNQGVISPIREVEAISIPEVAIDRRHLTFTLDFRRIGHLSIIEQDIHHKGPIGRDARCWRHPLDGVNFYKSCHLGSSTGGFLTQSPIHRQPYKLIHDFFLGHSVSFPSTYVLSCSFLRPQCYCIMSADQSRGETACRCPPVAVVPHVARGAAVKASGDVLARASTALVLKGRK